MAREKHSPCVEVLILEHLLGEPLGSLLARVDVCAAVRDTVVYSVSSTMCTNLR